MNERPLEADIGVIGGSGLYALLDGATEHQVSTPYGPPSDPITVAEVGGRRVAFLPRHGRDHRFSPAPDPLPGQSVGAARARGTADHRALRGRRPASGAGSGHVRRP
nr:hypothetical protein GCM10020092_096480 [Actinoplanes digitatis]